MKILQKPTSASGADESTSLREAFRASLSVMPGSEEARKMTVTSGRICSAVLTKSDLIGSFVKMLLVSSQWSSKARFLKWQVKGLFSTRVTEFADTDLSRPLPCNVSATTLRDTDIPSSRCLFQLLPLEPPTDAIGFSSSDTVILQTPTAVQTDETPEKMRARAERNGYKNGTKYGSLTSQVKYDPRVREMLMPTPLAVERAHPERVAALKESGATQIFSRKNGSSRPNGIIDFMTFYNLLLTPSASDGLRGNLTMDSLMKHNKVNAEKSNLAEQIAHMIGGGPSQLNPLFTEEMMGFPLMWTTSPFLSTNGGRKVSKHTETPSSHK